jgi:hypothetical protein
LCAGTIDARWSGVTSSTSTKAAIAIELAGILSGCSAIVAPTAPSASTTTAAVPASPVTTIGLTVRVLVRGSEEPVPFATVFRDNAAVGQTNTDGILQAQVPRGIEFSIDVTAPGFVGCGASASVTTLERWTFYLERVADAD